MAEYRTIIVAATVSKNSVSTVAKVETQIRTTNLPEYEGPYVITPSSETQTLSTEQVAMTSNVVINPIPSNYGLITWNGSTLTVS